MCEEFHCLPSVAWREAQQLPAGMLETILEFRAYARAKAAFDREGQPRGTRPDLPMAPVVEAIAFQLVEEAITTDG